MNGKKAKKLRKELGTKHPGRKNLGKPGPNIPIRMSSKTDALSRAAKLVQAAKAAE
jgi:hypothetical protein